MANNKPEWTNYIPYADGDSLDDVKKAYKSLAKSMHPDSGDGNEEKIRKLNKAWEDAQKWFKSETAEKKEDKKTNTKDFIKNKEKELKLKELKLNYFCDELSDDEIKSSILYDVNKKGNAPKDFEQNFKINTIKKCDVYIFKYIGNFDVSMSLTHGVLDDVLYKHAYN
ncbi:MAG: DnaJ domain-containing protein [Alphaproteobacteria bacterium]